MRILVATTGSWGDVLPLIPVVQVLDRRGHDVTMAVPPIFVRSLRRAGITAARVGGRLTPKRIDRLQDAVAGNRDGNAPFEAYWRHILLPDAEAMAQDLQPLAEAADIVVSDRFNIAADVVAGRLDRPRITVAWTPACVRSDGYSPPGDIMSRDELAGGFEVGARPRNHRAWDDELDWARRALDGMTNEVLERAGAPPVDAAPFDLQLRADALVLTWHESLLPSQEDWPEGVHQVGYPYIDQIPGSSSDDVDGFLDDGRAPVLVCFGTAIAAGAEGTCRQVVDHLLRRGERVLVLGPDLALPANASCFTARFLPLSRVAHRCRAVVHHGGPGTLIGALRAAAPSLVIPQFIDQPQTAALVHHLGVGTGVRPWEVDHHSLDAALDLVLADAAAARAGELAAQLAEEPDPAERFADHIEALAP